MKSATGTIEDAFHEPTSALARGVEDLLLQTALYPYSKRLGMELGRQLRGPTNPKPPAVAPPTWTPNIPLDEYEKNLRRIAELAGRRGAAVWFLTSPDAFTTNEYRTDEYGTTAKLQSWVLSFSGIHSFAELAKIHASYNDATRRVATELGVPLVDLEQAYRLHADEHLFLPNDAIHPNDAGHALEAEALYRKLAEAGVVGHPRAPSPSASPSISR